MRHAAVLLTLLATAVLLVIGCDTVPIGERYGQLLSPKDVKDCPKGCTPYVTAPGDRLYVLADRAYGEGYKMYRIANLKENQDTLKAITKADGTLDKGKIIFLPPDERGDRVTPENRWHFGGTSKR